MPETPGLNCEACGTTRSCPECRAEDRRRWFTDPEFRRKHYTPPVPSSVDPWTETGKFSCICGREYDWSPESKGKKVACPCGKTFTMPGGCKCGKDRPKIVADLAVRWRVNPPR